jgi:hypothetical protein
MRYRNMRMLGGAWLASDGRELDDIVGSLGPDAAGLARGAARQSRRPLPALKPAASALADRGADVVLVFPLPARVAQQRLTSALGRFPVVSTGTRPVWLPRFNEHERSLGLRLER